MTTARRRREGGFSLIEILVVLALIALLMGIVATGALSFGEAGRITDAQARIESLSLVIESYADRMGAYPPSTLAAAGVAEANRTNEGVEALVAALKSRDYGGQRPNERWLGNVDGDSTKGITFVDGSTALLEVLDPWDNPFAYVASTDYDRECPYNVLGDATDIVPVRAMRNPLTGAFHRFESFQLRSAGPDGLFDTEDDLANFAIEE